MFDGTKFHMDVSIYVEAGVIQSITVGRRDLERKAEILDFPNATIMPGLVDSHTHLAFNSSEDPVGHLKRIDDIQLLAEMRAAAKQALVAGVTSLRDLGDRSFLAAKLRDDPSSHPAQTPDIVPAGPPITIPNGHCWFLGGQISKGKEAIRRAVEERAQKRVAVIKVMATGGELTPGSSSATSQFSEQELRFLVTEARKYEIPVVAHAHGRDGILAAMRAGCDGIEHASFLTNEGLEPDDAVISELANRSVHVGINMGFLPEPSRRPRKIDISGLAVKLAKKMIAAKVAVVFNTDAGISRVVPHDALPKLVVSAVSHGFGVQDVLTSVTSRAADACKLPSKGRLVVNSDADLLVVRGDVSSDIASITRPIRVWHRGILV